MSVENIRDFGQVMSEATFKAGLLKMNPNLVFDLGQRMDFKHLYMENMQGVYLNNPQGFPVHVAPMGRGMLPENNVWSVRDMGDGAKRRDRIIRCGWGYTLASLYSKRVPGITWENIVKVFKIDRKPMPKIKDQPLVELRG